MPRMPTFAGGVGRHSLAGASDACAWHRRALRSAPVGSQARARSLPDGAPNTTAQCHPPSHVILSPQAKDLGPAWNLPRPCRTPRHASHRPPSGVISSAVERSRLSLTSRNDACAPSAPIPRTGAVGGTEISRQARDDTVGWTAEWEQAGFYGGYNGDDGPRSFACGLRMTWEGG